MRRSPVAGKPETTEILTGDPRVARRHTYAGATDTGVGATIGATIPIPNEKRNTPRGEQTAAGRREALLDAGGALREAQVSGLHDHVRTS